MLLLRCLVTAPNLLTGALWGNWAVHPVYTTSPLGLQGRGAVPEPGCHNTYTQRHRYKHTHTGTKQAYTTHTHTHKADIYNTHMHARTRTRTHTHTHTHSE